MTFEGGSSLETICEYAISDNGSLKSIVFPPSVKCVNVRGIYCNHNLESVEFLGDYVKIAAYNFQCCSEGMVLSFPNAKKLEFDEDSMYLLPEGSKVKIRRGAKLVGEEFSKIESNIEFIEGNGPSNQKVDNSSKKVYQESKNTKIKKEEEFSIERSSIKNKSEQEYSEVISRCMKRIRFLESRLGMYEEVFPFDMNCETSDEEVESETNDKETDSEEEMRGREGKNIFIDEEEESHQRVICQIGEGATSVTYKVIDERRDKELCKKVLKAEEGRTTFNDFRNIYKECEVLAGMNHPSICKCVGLNPQEKLNDDDKDANEEEDEIEIKSKFTPGSTNKDKSKTTIAIFLKFHPMNLRECLERDILNNTLKAKLVVEIAFGMLHIHEHGMIHRDLKHENVMVNYIFEAQLIDFGLAHVDAMKSTMTSMTKGIGTLAYMSPEMSNEEEYDNKTDVYSFGVLLFVLFTRRFPKQNLKDKLNNKPIKFPEASHALISPYQSF
ncbi:hypothetical protein M9Y10_035911 [Tritrichomonas musculus]|uniref:non-specific serine/threonine protein kinase n=1 Tax=Tritrichomonas musculus TaxID=1915356 RepID=A0ABR2GVL2_9EUKA